MGISGWAFLCPKKTLQVDKDANNCHLPEPLFFKKIFFFLVTLGFEKEYIIAKTTYEVFQVFTHQFFLENSVLNKKSCLFHHQPRVKKKREEPQFYNTTRSEGRGGGGLGPSQGYGKGREGGGGADWQRNRACPNVEYFCKKKNRFQTMFYLTTFWMKTHTYI